MTNTDTAGAADQTPTTPAAHLGVLTHRLTASLQRALRTALSSDEEADGEDRIGPRHHAVLVYLSQTGSRAVDVARETGLHKQVVGTLVDDLERLGYVAREPDPTDRRGKLIVPTDLGRQRIIRINAAMGNIEQQLAAALGEDRYRTFKRTLQQVVTVLEAPR